MFPMNFFFKKIEFNTVRDDALRYGTVRYEFYRSPRVLYPDPGTILLKAKSRIKNILPDSGYNFNWALKFIEKFVRLIIEVKKELKKRTKLKVRFYLRPIIESKNSYPTNLLFIIFSLYIVNHFYAGISRLLDFSHHSFSLAHDYF